MIFKAVRCCFTYTFTHTDNGGCHAMCQQCSVSCVRALRHTSGKPLYLLCQAMVYVYCTSDICADVLPLVPSITIARAAEMLKGETKIFAVLSSSPSFWSKAREKVVLALDLEIEVDDAIVPDTKKKDGRAKINQHILTVL